MLHRNATFVFFDGTLEHLSTVTLHRTVVLVNDATLNCDAICTAESLPLHCVSA